MSCCGACACGKTAGFTAPWTRGSIDTPAGPVPIVPPRLDAADILGAFRVRLVLQNMMHLIDFINQCDYLPSCR